MKPIKKIVIVGGGSAGWIAASMLSAHFKNNRCQIELVESDEVSALGIGESTIPPFVRLIQQLGIEEQQFIQATEGCFKLGIKFVDWHKQDASYFHPFGVIGKRIDSYDFYQCWLKSIAHGNSTALQDYSPCAVMASQGRFFPPQQMQYTPMGGANYAMHMDAKLLAGFLRKYSEDKGVKRTEGLVTRVVQDPSGNIDSIELANGKTISGDFFIDCTGFKALLIEQTLKAGFEDWSRYLPCDRAVAVKTEPRGPILPYTTATAANAGWTWRIPLRNQTGYGYTYASQFCSDAEARSTLISSLDGPRVSSFQIIPFTSGRRREFWKNNCLSLGLAAGFIEPLESTALHLIARGMDFFLRFFPDKDCEPSLIREYNRRMSYDYDEVRDFIVLHYCTTQREDTPFWQRCKNMELPASLEEKIELFKAHGLVRDGVDELFRSSSWQSVFEGMGIRPAKYSPGVDNLDLQKINDTLGTARAAILAMVKNLPTHDEFLQHNHAPSASNSSAHG